MSELSLENRYFNERYLVSILDNIKGDLSN